MKSLIKPLLFAAAGQLADILTTKEGIARGACEGNLLLRPLAEHRRYGAIAGIKMLGVALCTLPAIARPSEKSARDAKQLLLANGAVGFAVAANNLVVIRRIRRNNRAQTIAS
ncbi:MAG: hypothetical protein Q8Q39_00650 [bacterium]|nr:hypothetical protein [bacterium]